MDGVVFRNIRGYKMIHVLQARLLPLSRIFVSRCQTCHTKAPAKLSLLARLPSDSFPVHVFHFPISPPRSRFPSPCRSPPRQIHSFFGDDEGAGGAGAEAAGQEHLLPTLRNILVENVDVSVSTRTPFIIEGLPERPVTGLVVRNVTVGKWGKRGWDCKHYGGCSWAGGGCALGVVAGVEPPPLEGCIRLQAPATKRR